MYRYTTVRPDRHGVRRDPRGSRRRRSGTTLALAGALALTGCANRKANSDSPDGAATEIERERYIRKAIRSSSEGVILLPSKRAETVFELPRLNEIAQRMRSPMAACFVRRALETMELTGDPEQPYTNVPEGQLKMRTRINPAGQVVRAEVLESGFADDSMEPCLTDVLRMQRWPENQTGNTHYIDVVYWVSLGLQGDIFSESARQHLRREEIAAGVRGKNCLQGRVDAGTYDIAGLNLVNREGATMANRVDHRTLPGPIRTCLAKAMQSIRLDRDADAFVRPVAPNVRYTVGSDGTVAVDGEQWLQVMLLEDRARAAKKRAELTGDAATRRDGGGEGIDELPARRPSGLVAGGSVEASVVDAAGEQASDQDEPDQDAPDQDEPGDVEPDRDATPRKDPGKGGLRLNLGGGR